MVLTNFYAQLHTDGTVVAVSQLAGAVEATNMIALEGYDATLIGKRYERATGSFVSPAAPGPAPEPAWAWLMDIGPFVDRFGAERYAVEQSTDPFVVSFRHDVDTRRKWIDLRDQRVAAALYYLAGQPLPGVGTIAAPILTSTEVATILTTPVALAENLALRKLYFS